MSVFASWSLYHVAIHPNMSGGGNYLNGEVCPWISSSSNFLIIKSYMVFEKKWRQNMGAPSQLIPKKKSNYSDVVSI
jgi:hypothetical protein